MGCRRVGQGVRLAELAEEIAGSRPRSRTDRDDPVRHGDAPRRADGRLRPERDHAERPEIQGFDWVYRLNLIPTQFRDNPKIPEDRRKDLAKWRLFSVPTRMYLRRRAWRYFRKLGRRGIVQAIAIPPEEADDQFGWIARFDDMDCTESRLQTQ